MDLEYTNRLKELITPRSNTQTSKYTPTTQKLSQKLSLVSYLRTTCLAALSNTSSWIESESSTPVNVKLVKS